MKKLEPQSYLTKRGVEIFHTILECIDKKILQSTDSFFISFIANNWDLNHIMAEFLNTNGVSQVTSTNYSQVRAEYTVYKNTGEVLAKNLDKIGMTPDARAKFESLWAKKEKKKPGISSLMNGGNSSST